MSVKITFGGNELIRESENCVKVMKTAGKYLAGDVRIEHVAEPDFGKVLFFDFDGSLLFQFTPAEIRSLDELPSPPAHSGLTFLEWNWTLSELKAANRPIIVGANYRTTDGHTRLHIVIPDEDHLSVNVQLFLNGTMAVDWGDGTTSPAVTKTNSNTVFHHSYSAPGAFVIRFLLESGSIGGINQNHPILSDGTKRESAVGGSEFGFNSLLLRKIEAGTETVVAQNSQYNTSWKRAFSNINSVESISLSTSSWLTGEAGGPVPDFIGSRFRFIALPRGVTAGGNSNVRSFSPFLISVPNSFSTFSFANAKGLSAFSVPESVTAVAQNTFQNCYTLRSVSLPSSLTEIGTNAFQSCNMLRSIAIPEGVTSIGAQAFYDCNTLKSASIPESLETIGQNAFLACTSLEKITIPENVSTIGLNAFGNCVTATSVVVPPLLSIGNQTFAGDPQIRFFDFTAWTIADIDVCAFGSNIFQGISSTTRIIFRTQEIADHAKTVANLAGYSNYIYAQT